VGSHLRARGAGGAQLRTHPYSSYGRQPRKIAVTPATTAPTQPAQITQSGAIMTPSSSVRRGQRQKWLARQPRES
jgi:hypothetical protein